MMTFKQLEALFWIVRLGSFAQAATKLHTTQSAVSKRVQELEALFGIPLFDRAQRSARLTEKGEEMFAVARRLLEQRDLAMEQFQSPDVVERRLRLGVTELTAMTWLPRLVARVQTFYPRVVIEPIVDSSSELRSGMLSEDLDLVIVPGTFDDDRFRTLSVGELELVWMAKPGLVGARRSMRIHDLARFRLLLQSTTSGTGLILSRWLESMGMKLTSTVTSDNMVALVGMVVSGLGIAYLPRRCLQPMISAKMLEVVKVSPAMPKMKYVALYRADQRSTLVSSISMLAQESCDFSRVFQMADESRG